MDTTTYMQGQKELIERVDKLEENFGNIRSEERRVGKECRL